MQVCVREFTMHLKLLLTIISIFFDIPFVRSARILGIIPTATYSHQLAFHQLWKELSLRGHQVTVLTTDPMKDPTLTNLTEIDLHIIYKVHAEKFNFTEIYEVSQKSKFQYMKILLEIAKCDEEVILQHPEVQKLIKSKTQRFDLVMLEMVFAGMYVFAELFDCPTIGLSSADTVTFIYHLMGNPAHPVLQPDRYANFKYPLSFMEKVTSTYFAIFMNYYFDFFPSYYEEELVTKHFGERISPPTQIRKRMDMVFVSTDPIFHVIRPLVPAIVPIGSGNHLRAPKPLPNNLQQFLDNATEGVIYFSMGTTLRSGNLHEKTRRAILETFAELPYKVLWKFDDENVRDKPNNVFIYNWVPQQDVLRHANIKLFVTQGGLQSLYESICSHVPVVGLPFFTDQPTNMKKLVEKGVGLSLDYKTITKESFKSAILDVINNPKYRSRVKELATLMQDQPMTGIETAIWWTEYVLRHKGAKHLRSPAIDLPFYQYYLLDVICFCLLIITIVSYILFTLLKFIFKLVRYFVSKNKVKTEY